MHLQQNQRKKCLQTKQPGRYKGHSSRLCRVISEEKKQSGGQNGMEKAGKKCTGRTGNRRSSLLGKQQRIHSRKASKEWKAKRSRVRWDKREKRWSKQQAQKEGQHRKKRGETFQNTSWKVCAGATLTALSLFLRSLLHSFTEHSPAKALPRRCRHWCTGGSCATKIGPGGHTL